MLFPFVVIFRPGRTQLEMLVAVAVAVAIVAAAAVAAPFHTMAAATAGGDYTPIESRGD